MRHLSYRQLLESTSFCFYSASAFLSMFSYGMSYIALTWLVYQEQHTVGAITILMACFWLPTVVFSPFAGMLVDRFSRKRIYLFTCSSRGILLLALGIIEWHWHSVWAIYLISLLEGLVSCLVLPTVTALIREIVPEEHLLRANAFIDVAYESGNVTGMAFAGISIALFSITGSLIIDGGLFFVALLFAYGITTLTKVTPTQIENAKQVMDDVLAGFHYIKNSKPIQIAYTLEVFCLVSYMMVPVLTAPFATRFLHATVGQFGAIEAILSIGVVLGNFVVPRMTEKYGIFKILFFINIVLAFAFALFAINRDLYDAGVLNFIIGLCFASWPVVMTKAQQLTQLDFQGRIQAAYNALSGIVILTIYAVTYLVSKFFDVSYLYLFEVIFAILSALLLLRYRKMF